MTPAASSLLHAGGARARAAVVVCAGCGLAVSGLVLVQAVLLAHALARSAQEDASLRDLAGTLVALLAAILVRAALTWLGETAGHRAAAAAIHDLRLRFLRHLARLGPGALTGERTGELAATATAGLDGLDAYFARYLPQVVLAAAVPVAAVAVVLRYDLVAAITLAVTVPLIPVFMALIGVVARERARRRLATLSLLSAHFLDVLQGLPTLRAFRRGPAQVERIGTVTSAYRRATAATLRLAFLSSLTLELVATLGTALVAVGIGIRLAGGGLTLERGLTVLLLAPEVYLPMRRLSTHFHAGAEGAAAAQRVLEICARPASWPDPTVSAAGGPSLLFPVRLTAVRVAYPGRASPALDGFDLALRAGETVVLSGPSGAGKSTVAALLLRFVEPGSGTVCAGGSDARSVAADAWRAEIGWLPQRPRLLRRSLADNVRLGRPGATDDEVRAALAGVGLEPLVQRIPGGLHAPVGEDAVTLSEGEGRRVALARALLRGAPLLVVDEPLTGLDPEGRAAVLDALRHAGDSATVLCIGHEEELASIAHRVVLMDGGRALGEAPGGRTPGRIARAEAHSAGEGRGGRTPAGRAAGEAA